MVSALNLRKGADFCTNTISTFPGSMKSAWKSASRPNRRLAILAASVVKEPARLRIAADLTPGFICWTMLGYGLDNDFATVTEFIKDISDTRSFAVLEDLDRVEELWETLLRIEDRKALLGKPFERRRVNERLRQDEHLTLMYQQM